MLVISPTWQDGFQHIHLAQCTYFIMNDEQVGTRIKCKSWLDANSLSWADYTNWLYKLVLTNLRLLSWFLNDVRKSLISTLSCNLLTFCYYELLLTSTSLLRETFLTKLQWLPLFKRWLDFYVPWLLEHALHASKRVLGPTPYLKRPFWETTDSSFWPLLCHSRTWKKMRVMSTLLCSMTTPKKRVFITPCSYWGWALRRESCHGWPQIRVQDTTKPTFWCDVLEGIGPFGCLKNLNQVGVKKAISSWRLVTNETTSRFAALGVSLEHRVSFSCL